MDICNKQVDIYRHDEVEKFVSWNFRIFHLDILLDFNFVLVSRIYPLGPSVIVTNYTECHGMHTNLYSHYNHVKERIHIQI